MFYLNPTNKNAVLNIETALTLNKFKKEPLPFRIFPEQIGFFSNHYVTSSSTAGTEDRSLQATDGAAMRVTKCR